MGLATALPYRSLRLTPSPSACRRGSNGEAEARIPLKNKYLFILATHNNNISTFTLFADVAYAEDGIGYCAPSRSLRLTPAPSACRRGSNGEAEARIPLKINISFILATHTTFTLTNKSRAQKARFLVEELSAACRRKAHTTKKRKVKTLRLLLGWKMGLEPTTLGTTILYSNQLSYIHHLDLITQIGCKYRVFIVSLQIYLQKFSENNRYPIYNYSQTTADGTSPSHRSPSPAPQPYSHCLPAHPPPACCVHRPCNIPQ